LFINKIIKQFRDKIDFHLYVEDQNISKIFGELNNLMSYASFHNPIVGFSFFAEVTDFFFFTKITDILFKNLETSKTKQFSPPYKLKCEKEKLYYTFSVN